MCIFMVPVLSVNLAWILQSYMHPDQIPTVFGYMVFVVTTDSMSPEICGGDVVVVKETDVTKLTEGDIITFYDPSEERAFVVTHRIHQVKNDAVGKLFFETKGDANNTADQELVPKEKVIGKLFRTIPKIGRLILFLQKPEGIFLCIVIPLVLLVIYLLISTKRMVKNAENGRPRAVSINEEKERPT